MLADVADREAGPEASSSIANGWSDSEDGPRNRPSAEAALSLRESIPPVTRHIDRCQRRSGGAAPARLRRAAKLLEPIHVLLLGALARLARALRRCRAGPRSAARRGRPRSRARPARRRPAGRGGRGSSPAASASRSRAGSARGRCPTVSSQSSITAVELVGRADVEARREHVAASPGRRPIRSSPPAQLDQLAPAPRSERPMVSPAPAVFSSRRSAAVGLVERAREHLGDPLASPPRGLALGRPGVEHHAVGADRVAQPERVDQRLERLAPQVASRSRRS